MEERIRLLLADDRPRSRNGMRALLTTWSRFDIVGEATDGQEAIRLVEECQPDVVLIDVRMPILDGLAATRLIKSRWPAVKVVVLSLYPLYRAEALAAGADAFLVKGCLVNELLTAILGNAHDEEVEKGGKK